MARPQSAAVVEALAAVTVARLHTIGGSEIVAAVGLDPFTSPIMLAARKLGLAERQPESEAMRLGKRLEPLIAELAEEEGYPIIPAPAERLADPERAWCVGTPDGYCGVAARAMGGRTLSTQSSAVAYGMPGHAEGAARAVAELKAVGQLAHREGWNGMPR